MALIQCKECGNKVSDKAFICPKCGAPVQSAQALFTEQPTIKVQEVVPQQFATTIPLHEKNAAFKIISILMVIAVVVTVFFTLQSEPDSIADARFHGTPPSPVVVSSKVDKADTTAHTAVFATIQNQGGDGPVFVTFTVHLDNNDYEVSRPVFMKANQILDLAETFKEVKFPEGKIKFNVDARVE